MMLVHRRLAEEMSLDEAAKKIGISRNTLEKAELGGRVRMDVAKKIARYYGLQLTEVLGAGDSMSDVAEAFRNAEMEL